jgi:hypothetical protein
MTKLRKFVEWLADGRRTDRVAYVTDMWALPEPVTGAEWSEDKSFNAAEEILARPKLKATYRTALAEGCAIVTTKRR